MAVPTSQELTHAYRHLYRNLLNAVQYSKPARYTARDQLRDAFRKDDPSAFNKERIDRTIEFLRLAAQEAGLEHKLVRNLLFTSWCRRRAYQWDLKDRKPMQVKIRKTSMIHYDMTVAMLNDSMGLCLRWGTSTKPTKCMHHPSDRQERNYHLLDDRRVLAHNSSSLLHLMTYWEHQRRTERPP